MLKSHLFSQPWGDTLYYCLVPNFVNWHVFLNSAHGPVAVHLQKNELLKKKLFH